MAKDKVECGFLTLRANKNVCFPICGGGVVTIGSKDDDHILIKGKFDKKTDAVLTACKDTGFVLVSNPEKCSTILNEKPLTKPQYLTPGDTINIKNKIFTYNNDVLTDKEVDELILKNAGHIHTAPKMGSSIHPVPKGKQETEVVVLSANASKFQADYIVGITPSRPNSKHIVSQPKTVSSALSKSKLFRRYSSDDIFITGSFKKNENDNMESLDNEVVNQTPLETKKISLAQSCSPRMLRLMQIASRSPTLIKPRRLFLEIKFTFKSPDKLRSTENVHLSQSHKSTKKTEVERRRSDFQECLDVEHTESLTDIICNSESCESQEHTETRQEEEERNTNTSFGQSTSTLIQLPDNRRAASESKLIPKFGRIERDENIIEEHINEENVSEENVSEENSDRNLIEGLFELSRNASNIEQSLPKSPRTLQHISTNRQLLINAIFGKHNSTLSGSPVFRKASTSFQENENKESCTPQYEDISMDDKTDKLEISCNVPSQSSPNHSEDNNVLISNKRPLNDLSNVEGVNDMFRNSPINDLRNIPSLKRLFTATSPVNDLRNVQEVRQLFKQRNTPRNDLTNVEGVKEILQRRSVYNNISDTAGVKQLFEQRSPKNNLDDVTGVNRLFKRQNTPTNDLTNVEGVKDVLRRRTVYNNLSEVAGVKQLFEQHTPNNNLVDVEGVGNVFKVGRNKDKENEESNAIDIEGNEEKLRKPRNKRGIHQLLDVSLNDINSNSARRTRRDLRKLKDEKIKGTQPLEEPKTAETINKEKAPVRRTRRNLTKNETVDDIQTDKSPVKRTRRAAQNEKAPIGRTKKDLQKHTKDETGEESKMEENINETKSQKKSSVKRPRRGLQELKDEADEATKMDDNVSVSKSEKTPAWKTSKGVQTRSRALKNLKDDNVKNAKDISKEDENMPVKSCSTRRKDNKENDNLNDMEKEDDTSEDVILSGSSKDEKVVNKRTRNVAKNDKKGEAEKVDEKKKEEIPIRFSRRNVGKVVKYY